jgi:hypothetical protein
MSKKKRPMFSSFAGHSQLMLRIVLRCVAQERLRGWATPLERHNLDLRLSCPGRKLPTRNSRRLSRTSPGGVQMRCAAPPLHPLYLDPGPRLGRPVPSYNAMAPGGSRTPDATPPRTHLPRPHSDMVPWLRKHLLQHSYASSDKQVDQVASHLACSTSNGWICKVMSWSRRKGVASSDAL